MLNLCLPPTGDVQPVSLTSACVLQEIYQCLSDVSVPAAGDMPMPADWPCTCYKRCIHVSVRKLYFCIPTTWYVHVTHHIICTCTCYRRNASACRLYLCLLSPECHLCRHDPLSLSYERALGAHAVPPPAVSFVPLHTIITTVIVLANNGYSCFRYLKQWSQLL